VAPSATATRVERIAMADSSSKWILSTVYRIKKRENWPRPNKKGCRATIILHKLYTTYAYRFPAEMTVRWLWRNQNREQKIILRNKWKKRKKFSLS
jgi:hypothetical protein